MESGMGPVPRTRSGVDRSIHGDRRCDLRQRRDAAKEIELLSIAMDASYTHMYAPGTRRHIKGALKAGATMEEIMEVLKLCVVQGVQACNLGVPILAEELARVQ